MRPQDPRQFYQHRKTKATPPNCNDCGDVATEIDTRRGIPVCAAHGEGRTR
jgi:hypothetical protein